MVAAALMLGHVRTAASCAACRRPEFAARRKAWGCDEPTPQKLFSVPCHACPDLTYPEPGCATCNGTGWRDVHRCPMPAVGGAAHVARAVLAAEQVGILPAAGGWLDQVASFERASRIVGVVRAAFDEGGKDDLPPDENPPAPMTLPEAPRGR